MNYVFDWYVDKFESAEDVLDYVRKDSLVSILCGCFWLAVFRTDQNWSSFIELSLWKEDYADYALRFYKEVPEELRADWIMKCYMIYGENLHSMHRAIQEVRRYKSPRLPKAWKDEMYIPVYRVGPEEIDRAKYGLSWTTDQEAVFRLYTESENQEGLHVWKGYIRPRSIIAYMTISGRPEVVQFKKVKGITEITDEANGNARKNKEEQGWNK